MNSSTVDFFSSEYVGTSRKSTPQGGFNKKSVYEALLASGAKTDNW
jgi:hypothetical protein